MFEPFGWQKVAPTGAAGRRPRILVVDDEPSVRQFVYRILQTEEVDLLEAGDGKEALAVVESQSAPIDLLLTDIDMPVMDGQQLASTLRSRFPKLKVLFFTGVSDRLFRQADLLPDDCAFEDKPITPRGLCQAVNLLLYGTLTRPGAGSADRHSRR
jgi:two-component system cell cycle sensor histidine kinase/response regulator CckA